MKKIFTLLAVISTMQLGFAQEEGGPDTTRFTVGSMEFIIVDRDTMMVEATDENGNKNGDDNKKFHKHKDNGDLTYWSGFEVGINLLMNNQFENSFTESHLQMDPANSFSYSFNFFEKRIRFGTDHIGLVTGLGFTNSRFGFKDDHLRLASNADSTYGVYDSTLTSGFNINQLRVNYFNIPILIHINTSKYEKKNFHLSFGIIGGVRMSSKVKYKYDVLGGETKR